MKCPHHHVVMTWGRYSDEPIYCDCHHGNYFCHECVDVINALIDMMSVKEENEIGFWDRFHYRAELHGISRAVQEQIVTGL